MGISTTKSQQVKMGKMFPNNNHASRGKSISQTNEDSLTTLFMKVDQSLPMGYCAGGPFDQASVRNDLHALGSCSHTCPPTKCLKQKAQRVVPSTWAASQPPKGLAEKPKLTCEGQQMINRSEHFPERSERLHSFVRQRQTCALSLLHAWETKEG